MFKRNFILLAVIMGMAVACKNTPQSSVKDSFLSLLPAAEQFRDTIDGKPTDLYILKNKQGMYLAITNFGGRIVSLVVPDKSGKPVDVIVGSASLKDFKASTEPYFGALIGRVGNRIAKGKFTIYDEDYQLLTNNGPNTLHGGINGYHNIVWSATQKNDSTLELRYLSPDGEEGFPGNMEITMVYSVSDNNEIRMSYQATTDKKTPVNLTNHAFFNLNGIGSGTINNHTLLINAQKYLPVDATLIPLGSLESVENTPFDFRKPTTIGLRIDTMLNEQLKYGKGYDHNFVLYEQKPKSLIHAATVIGDASGITMEIFTMEPGLQFYGGNFMKGNNTLKYGFKDDFRTAFCLETQHFPDSPNQLNFPTVILSPGETYETLSVYRFLVTH